MLDVPLMKKNGSLVAGIALLLGAFAGPARAEEMSLQQAVEIAVQNNADLQAFRDEKGLREAGRIRAGLLPNPSLEVSLESGALTGNSGENAFSVGVSQEFLLAGKRAKRVALAQKELEVYGWQLADRERLLKLDAKSRFYQVLLAVRKLKLTEGAIELNRHLYQVAKERLAAGDIPELELNLVQVELARSEGARSAALEALSASRAELSLLLGGREVEPALPTGSLEAGGALKQAQPDLFRLALERRPDLMALRAEAEKGSAELALARAEGIPNLTAGLGLKRDTTAVEVAGLEGKDTSYTVGLTLSMPIPLFDKNQPGLREASARRDSAGNRLAAATSRVEREVAAAYASLSNAEQVLSLYLRNIVPQMEENLKLTREAYQLGEVPVLTVFEEQKKYLEVNQGYLEALYQRQLALFRLEAAAATELTGGVQ